MIKSPLLIWFAQSPLCAGLSEDESDGLYALFEEQTLPIHTVLYREGEPADALYVVLEGRVEVQRAGVTLGEVGPGGSVGEMGLFSHATQRSATVECATSTTVLRISRDAFQQALRERRVPALLVANLAQQLAERLSMANARLAPKKAA